MIRFITAPGTGLLALALTVVICLSGLVTDSAPIIIIPGIMIPGTALIHTDTMIPGITGGDTVPTGVDTDTACTIHTIIRHIEQAITVVTVPNTQKVFTMKDAGMVVAAHVYQTDTAQDRDLVTQ